MSLVAGFDRLEGRNLQAALDPGTFVMLNPQPLPPVEFATLNPQPLPPESSVDDQAIIIVGG